MKIKNTKDFRGMVLDRIEADGVRLKEFTKDQKVKIIKTYAAVLFSETKNK